MQILFLSHRNPYPPHKGNQIRPFNVLKALKERGHEVHLVGFAEDAAEIAAASPLSAYCSSYHLVTLEPGAAKMRAARSLLTGKPPSVEYFNSPDMRSIVETIVSSNPIQAVVVYSSTMSQYVPEALRPHTFVDMADVDSEKWMDYAEETNPPMKWVYGLEGRRLREYEYWIVRNFGITSLHTQREIDVLKDLSPDELKRLIPITNGVDLEKFKPTPVEELVPGKIPEAERRFFDELNVPRVVFTGAMDYRPNAEACIWFANDILPLIRAKYPNARFQVVGSKPTAEVLALGGDPGIDVTGFVDSVLPYLAAATVCVVPLKIARGVQNKALEAMAAGRAVIATRDVITGVGAREGQHLLHAQTEGEFADKVINVIADRELRAGLESQARSFVVESCSWGPLMNRLVELVESIKRPLSQAAGTGN